MNLLMERVLALKISACRVLGLMIAVMAIGMADRASAGNAYSVDENTIQLWHFDETVGGKINHVSGTASGELVGGVEKVNGKYGGAFQFNGKDGKVRLSNGAAVEIGPTQGFTVEAWIKVAKHGETQQILTGSPFVELEVRREGGVISFNLQTIDQKTSLRCTGRKDVTDGKWHHVAGVRDPINKTISVYIDGKLDAQVVDTTLGSKLLILDTLYVGGTAAGTEMLGGIVDEIRISGVNRDVVKLAHDNLPPAKIEQHVLENDHVRMTFDAAGSTLYLSSLFDKKRNLEFISPIRAENIWQATMNSKAGMTAMDEVESPLAVERWQTDQGETLEFTWKNLPLAGKSDQVDVVATVTLPKDSSMSDWRINLDNRSDEYGLWIARFPRITNLAKLSEDGSKDFIAIPGGNGGGAGEGQLYKDPHKTLTHPFIRTYPCYHQSMQFNAYYNDKAGLYLAAYDGKMNLKGFLLQPQEGEPSTVLYEMYQYPADAGVAGTGLKQEYPHLIGTFGGDWYDASKIYRQWAINQVWCQAGKLDQRKDISSFIQNGAYWMVGSFEWEPYNGPFLREKFRQMSYEEAEKTVQQIDVERTLALVGQAREFFGFPLLLWTNEWFDGGGDLAPPRYISKGNLAECLRQIHEQYPDVFVSGHMQMKRYSTQLAEYDKEVEKSLEHTPDGRLAIEPLGTLFEDKYDQHAYPCWYTDFWKSFWTNKSKAIVQRTGLDGFHTDELGSATSFDAQCFNVDHGHTIGGGTLYADTRRNNIKMLRDSARTVNPDFAIHHEALCEIYLDRVDLAEVDTTPSNKNVPMFEAVYHDYAFVMGRRIHPWMDRRTFKMGDPAYGDNRIDEFVSSFAQTFVWGNQPGWTRLDIVEYSPQVAEVIKRFMQVRYRNMKFLNVGESIRQLTIKTPLPMITNIWTTSDTPENILPAVLNSAWKSSDGHIGIVLANITNSPQPIHYEYDLSESGGMHQQWRLLRTDGETQAEVGVIDGNTLERTDEVPPRSVIVIEAVPQN